MTLLMKQTLYQPSHHGWMVFYLFGPLDLVYGSSSISSCVITFIKIIFNFFRILTETRRAKFRFQNKKNKKLTFMSVWEPWRPLEKAFVRHRIRVLAFQLIALRIGIWSCCNNNILAGPRRKD